MIKAPAHKIKYFNVKLEQKNSAKKNADGFQF